MYIAHSATYEVWVCVVHCASCCRCRGSRGGLVHIVDPVPHKPANGSTYRHAPRLLAAIKSETSMSIASRLPMLAADKNIQGICVQRMWPWAAGVCVYKKGGQGRAIEWPGWGWAELEFLSGASG